MENFSYFPTKLINVYLPNGKLEILLCKIGMSYCIINERRNI